MHIDERTDRCLIRAFVKELGHSDGIGERLSHSTQQSELSAANGSEDAGKNVGRSVKNESADSEFIFPSAGRDCQTSQLIGRMCSRVNAMDDGRQREECSYVLRTDTTVAV